MCYLECPIPGESTLSVMLRQGEAVNLIGSPAPPHYVGTPLLPCLSLRGRELANVPSLVIPSEESLRAQSRNLNADDKQKQDSSTALGMTSKIPRLRSE